MAMQQIGIPARTVIERIETLRAASGAQPARELKDGEPTGEDSEGSPTLYADAPELRIVATSDARGHPHAANEFPARSPRVSLVVIEGGRHAEMFSASA